MIGSTLHRPGAPCWLPAPPVSVIHRKRASSKVRCLVPPPVHLFPPGSWSGQSRVLLVVLRSVTRSVQGGAAQLAPPAELDRTVVPGVTEESREGSAGARWM